MNSITTSIRGIRAPTTARLVLTKIRCPSHSQWRTSATRSIQSTSFLASQLSQPSHQYQQSQAPHPLTHIPQPQPSQLSSHLSPLPPGSPTHFGAIVTGIDLSQNSLSKNPSLKEELVSAVYDRGVVIFRGQNHLTPEDEIAFAKLFSHHPDDLNDDDDDDDADDKKSNISYTGGAGTQHRLPQHPSIALVGTYSVQNYYGLTASSPGVYNDWPLDQRAWHCDGLADTDPPPDLTTMRCLITPENEGDEMNDNGRESVAGSKGATLFASSVKAAELLAGELSNKLEKKYGIHPEDVLVNYKLFEKYEIALEGTHLIHAEGSKGETEEGGWDVNLSGGTSVPLVIRERRTGKRSLVGTYHVASISRLVDVQYKNGTDGDRESDGYDRSQRPIVLDFEQANAYLAEAWRPALTDENIYKHKWQVGDLAAWSNRLVIHTATSTAAYEGQERLHTRIRLRSRVEDAPMGWKLFHES